MSMGVMHVRQMRMCMPHPTGGWWEWSIGSPGGVKVTRAGDDDAHHAGAGAHGPSAREDAHDRGARSGEARVHGEFVDYAAIGI